jgi:hypothetical protein
VVLNRNATLAPGQAIVFKVTLVIIFEVMGELEVCDVVQALLLVLVTLPEVRYIIQVIHFVFLAVEPHPSL